MHRITPSIYRIIMILTFLVGYYLLPTWHLILGPHSTWIRRFG